jgi:hypothetical protein
VSAIARPKSVPNGSALPSAPTLFEKVPEDQTLDNDTSTPAARSKRIAHAVTKKSGKDTNETETGDSRGRSATIPLPAATSSSKLEPKEEEGVWIGMPKGAVEGTLVDNGAAGSVVESGISRQAVLHNSDATPGLRKAASEDPGSPKLSSSLGEENAANAEEAPPRNRGPARTTSPANASAKTAIPAPRGGISLSGIGDILDKMSTLGSDFNAGKNYFSKLRKTKISRDSLKTNYLPMELRLQRTLIMIFASERLPKF